MNDELEFHETVILTSVELRESELNAIQSLVKAYLANRLTPPRFVVSTIRTHRVHGDLALTPPRLEVLYPPSHTHDETTDNVIPIEKP